MKASLLLLAISAVIAIWVAAKLKKAPKASERFPYKLTGPLFSPAERSFLGVLKQAISDEYCVFGKVRIADVVSVQPMRNRATWQRAFNRISAKHFDYVVCLKSDLSVVCCIELDDRSHQKSKRQERDTFIEQLCAAVALPLVRFPAQHAYSITEVRTQILAAVRDEISTQIPASVGTSIPHKNEKTMVDTQATTPLCPKCASPMVLRHLKSGSKAGDRYFGCSTFPKCGGITVAPN